MYVAVLIGLAAFLIFSILAAITFGNADLSLKDVYSVIAYKLFHIKSLSAYAEGAVHDQRRRDASQLELAGIQPRDGVGGGRLQRTGTHGGAR